jgi:hypothetical protein
LENDEIVEKWLTFIIPFARARNLQIVCITPRSFKNHRDIRTYTEAGPLDFINIYNNADYVFADSFHGICFSVILRKSFLALGNNVKNDRRKKSLLGLFNLASRLINDQSEINTYQGIDLNYTLFEPLIKNQMIHQKNCLDKILNLVE